MSCPRTGGGRRGDPHPPCGAKSVPLFPAVCEAAIVLMENRLLIFV